ETWLSTSGGDTRKTLLVSPAKIQLSEFNKSGTASLIVGRNNMQWKQISTGIDASSSMSSTTSGKESTLVFNRSESVFGNKTYTFSLVDFPEVKANLVVSNLELKINRPTIRVGVGSKDGKVNSSTAIEPIGGDSNWVLVDYSRDRFNWTVPPTNVNGSLVFELGSVKSGAPISSTGTVTGEITVRHSNEPRLIKKIIVEQNAEYRALPPFDYMVITFSATSSVSGYKVDIDSAVDILKTGVNRVDNNPVGYLGSVIDKASSDGITYMFWAGDEQTTGAETSYVNIPELNKVLAKYPNSKKQIEIGTSAWWYANTSNVKSAMITVSLYKGGTMEKVGTTFVNKVGSVTQSPLMRFSSKGKIISSLGATKATPQTYRTLYTPMFKLEYDLIDNTGVLINMENWN
ncbi:MAG: hypothetical protein ACRCVU_16205, partial [Flavobacterium sp.]